jgi:hypothetical protein
MYNFMEFSIFTVKLNLNKSGLLRAGTNYGSIEEHNPAAGDTVTTVLT